MKNKSLAFVLAASICFGVVVPVANSVISYALADSAATYEGSLSFDRYDLDSVIEIKSTDKLNYNGASYDINKAILKYPSGLNVNSKSFTLNEYGEYEIILKYNDDIYCKESFYVNGAYLTCSNPNTQIEYGNLNKQFAQKGYKQGLSIKAAEGDFIRFAKPINVYENSLTKLIYFNLVQMDQKVKNVDIRITDCYNPDLYLDILYKRGNKEILTYVSASAQGQRDFGLDKSQNGDVILDNDNYAVSPYDGTIMDSNNPTSGNYNNFMFYLDTSNKDRIRVIAETDIVYKKCIVTEFNNPSIYAYDFPGFTNGNVYLSISANNFENVESADLEIAEACGLSGAELQELIGKKYNDDNAPIFVSSLHENVHQIRCGSEFKVPSIKVLDDTGLKGETDYTVWYNYDSNARYMVSVENGKFIPKNLGFYTIVYNAKDYFGNVGEYRVDLVATSYGSDGISFNFNGLGDIITGKSYYLNKYTTESLNGEVNVSIEVTDPHGNTTVLTNPNKSYKVRYAGKYSVKYVYSDEFYEGEYLTTFTSIPNDKPVFDSDEITSSLYYIKGAEYSVDIVKAYIYGTNEPTPVDVGLYVSYDGGAFTKQDRRRITIDGNETVKFKYVANDDFSNPIYSRVAKISDVNYTGSTLNLGGYFDSSIFTDKSSDESGLNLKATSNGSGEINFINKLYLSAFTTNISVSKESKLDKFSVVLSDYYDLSNKITITFGSVNGVSQYISINNEPFKYVDLNWKDADIEVKYSSETSISVVLSKVNSNNQKISYSYELYNRVSLTNQYLFFGLDVQNAKVNDVISVNSIMKQKFDKYVTEDENGPIATIDKIETVQKIGSIVKIPTFYYVDVLSPASELNAKLTVKQTSPTSRVITATSGEVLNGVSNLYEDLEIVLDEFGKYQLLFDFVDGANNKIKSTEAARIRPVISVIDEVAPTITLNASSQKAKVGEKITPLDVVVSDNCTSLENLKVYYFVYNSNGAIVASCKKGDTFSISEKGIYTVYVYCTDENSNSAYVTYKLTIE